MCPSRKTEISLLKVRPTLSLLVGVCFFKEQIIVPQNDRFYKGKKISILCVMKIYLGSDHGGFEMKDEVRNYLTENNYDLEDLGCDSSDSCDYPVFGRAVGEAVVKDEGSLGILICGSGVGISIAANKVEGVRCALANSVQIAQLSREHNGANILAMGERTQFIDDPLEIVKTFLNTKVDQGERHVKRRAML